MTWKKIGWILLREGVIQRQQMEAVLRLQERHPDKLFGELVCRYYDIAEEEIETVFARQVLLPFLETWFLDAVRKKTVVKEVDMTRLVTGVHGKLAAFTRKIARVTTFAGSGERYEATGKSRELVIDGCLAECSVVTSMGEALLFRDIHFSVSPARNEVVLANPHIFIEIKTRLAQLHKKTSGGSPHVR